MPNYIIRKTKVDINYPVCNDNFTSCKTIARCYSSGLREIYPDKNTKMNLFVTGASGIIFGTLVLNSLNYHGYKYIKLVVIRKKFENSHDSYSRGLTYKNIVIDDFIEQGNTINRIVEHVRGFTTNNEVDTLCIGNRFTDDIRTIHGWRLNPNEMLKIIKPFKNIVCLRY